MKKQMLLKKKYNMFFLIYFIFFTSYFSLITLSKYVTNIRKVGNNSIAKWEVFLETSNSSDTLNIISGNTAQNYILKVTSTSEVAAEYSIEISDLPDDVEIKIDNGTYQTPVNNTIIFDNVGMFDANDSIISRTHILTFNVPIESDLSGVTEIDLEVKFTQIEPK